MIIEASMFVWGLPFIGLLFRKAFAGRTEALKLGF